ncbi:MAG TPA: hypothetical protein VFM54_10495 [Micromonosporaceae bacterium]|nr:hypothetical protein [Micromonosporaceae bacterium]
MGHAARAMPACGIARWRGRRGEAVAIPAGVVGVRGRDSGPTGYAARGAHGRRDEVPA